MQSVAELNKMRANFLLKAVNLLNILITTQSIEQDETFSTQMHTADVNAVPIPPP